jgi:hypothetical protein
MTTANHLINALASQDQDEANDAFNSMIQDKMSDYLEVKKVELASTIMDDLEEAFAYKSSPARYRDRYFMNIKNDGKNIGTVMEPLGSKGEDSWGFVHHKSNTKKRGFKDADAAHAALQAHHKSLHEATGAQRQYARQVRKAVAVGNRVDGKSKSMHTDELKAHVRKRFQQLGNDTVAGHANVIKDALKYRKLHAEETIVEGEHTAAKELVMYADNDSQLYRTSHQPIVANLKKKVKKGVYDHEKATKLWGYHADRAAQKYAKEHGDGTPWHKMFTPADRKQAARWFANGNKEEIHEDVVNEVLSGGSKKEVGPLSNAQLNRNVMTNIRRAVQALRVKGVNPNMAAAGHRDFSKLVAKNPKAPGYMLLRKLAPAKAQAVQSLTQAGVPLGGSLEANPQDFNQVVQRIKRFK